MSAFALGMALGQASLQALVLVYALGWTGNSPAARIISALSIAMNVVIVIGLWPLVWAPPE